MSNNELTGIEKMLKVEFVSDPRRSRFSPPKPPIGYKESDLFTHHNFELTPKIARDWLTYRIIRPDITPPELKHEEFRANRRYLAHHVRRWGRRFSGHPAETPYNPNNPYGLALTWDGFILNGQHRIAAVLYTGTTIRTTLSTNVPWSTFLVMEDSLKRNPGQMLGDGFPYANLAASIAKYLLPVLHGTEADEYRPRGYDQDVLDIAQGWPWFQDSEWGKTILATQKIGIPQAPLGAAVMGALAAGADVFEVQEFLNGLDPYYNKWETVGKNGEDPRKMLSRLFVYNRGRKDAQGRYIQADERGNAGVIREAMALWLDRHEDSMVKNWPTTLAKVTHRKDIPKFWNSDAIREFHKNNVS